MIDYIRENNKKVIITLLLIITTIILSIFASSSNDSNTLIINNYISKISPDINYKIENCDLKNILEENQIPYFKISNEVYDKINQEIINKFVSRVCYQNGEITYKASLNDHILSVLIIYSIESGSDLYHMEYKTYNIDTKTNNLIDNQKLLDKYDLSINDIENLVQYQLREYYEYEKTTKYNTNKSFSEYLKILNYEKITKDNMDLFIDNNKNIYLYKTYTESQAMIFDDNYPFINYEFKLN